MSAPMDADSWEMIIDELKEEIKKLRRAFFLRDVFNSNTKAHLFDSVEYYRLKKELKL